MIGVLLRIELADIRAEECVSSTVRDVEPQPPSSVGQRVVDTQECVCECNTCQCGSALPSFHVQQDSASAILECGLVSCRQRLRTPSLLQT